MEGSGLIIVVVGIIIGVVGGLWLLVAAFQESILWGVLVFFVPFAGLIFVILHWEEAKAPFLTGLVGTLIWIAGALMAGTA